MQKLRQNINGFSHVGVIVIMAVLLLLAIITWKFLTRHTVIQKSDSKSQTNSEKSTTQKPLSKVKELKWKEVPTDLQTAILETWNSRAAGWDKKSAEDCAVSPKTEIYKVHTQDEKFAMAGVGCDSGSLTLWVKVESKWQFVQSTQSGFTCDNVDKYHVPKEIIASWIGGETVTVKCYNFANQTERIL